MSDKEKEKEEFAYSSEDETGKYDSDKIDLKLFDLLGAIRRNDPVLYEDKFFFKPEDVKKNTTEDTKSQYQKEFEQNQAKEEEQEQRKSLIEGYFKGSGKENRKFKLDDLDNTSSLRTMTEMELQEQAKREFQRVVDEVVGDDDDDYEGDDDLFTRKEKTKEELEKEEEEYQSFRKQHELNETDKLGKKTASLTHLDQEAGLTEEDKFLRDYLMNREWKKPTKSQDEIFIEEDMAKDELNDELEIQSQEQNIENNLLPDATNNYRFKEQGGSHIKLYPTSYKSTIREKKPTKRELYNQRRNERYKQLLDDSKKEQRDKSLQLKRKLIRQVLELKHLTAGDGSQVDLMDLTSKDLVGIDEDDQDAENEYEELKKANKRRGRPKTEEEELAELEQEEKDEKKPKGPLALAWEKVESNAVVEELMYADIDDDEDEMDQDDEQDPDYEEQRQHLQNWNKNATQKDIQIRELRRQIRKDYEQYYELFYEEIDILEDKFKFKYKKVDKDDYGLTTQDILELDDEELDQVVPLSFVTRYDSRASSDKVKQQIKFKLNKVYQDKRTKPNHHHRRGGGVHYDSNHGYHDKPESSSHHQREHRKNDASTFKQEKGGAESNHHFDKKSKKEIVKKNNNKSTNHNKASTSNQSHSSQKPSLENKQQKPSLENKQPQQTEEAPKPAKSFTFKYVQEEKEKADKKRQRQQQEEKKSHEHEKPPKIQKIRTEEQEKASKAAFDDGFFRVKPSRQQQHDEAPSHKKQYNDNQHNEAPSSYKSKKEYNNNEQKQPKVHEKKVQEQPKESKPIQEKQHVDANTQNQSAGGKKKSRRGGRSKKKNEEGL